MRSSTDITPLTPIPIFLGRTDTKRDVNSETAMTLQAGLPAQWVILSTLFSILLTAAACPILVLLFRRQVSARMNRAAAGGAIADADEPFTAEPSAPGAPIPSRPELRILTMRSSLPRSPEVDHRLAGALRKRLRIACAYAAGALVHAGVMTPLFIASFGREFATPAVIFPVLLVFSFPVVPTVATVLAARPGTRMLWLAIGSMIVWVAPTEARSLVLSVAALHLLVPTVIYSLFNLRYWRAVASLVLILAWGASLFWLVGLEIGRKLVAGNTEALWLFRFVGLVLGLALAWPVLRWIDSRYRRKLTNDQDLFLDSWWALYTLIQTTIFLVRTESLSALWAVVGFLLYWQVKSALLPKPGGDQPERPSALLLLRVFGHDRRTEDLLDRITLRWRCLGPVNLIAGTDLAARNIAPDEFLAFIRRRLAREFLAGPSDIERRMTTLDQQADPGGRYRINQFYCHRDTWQLALNRLVGISDAILMDLRDFNSERQGCQYELTRLGDHLGEMPIVLLTDDQTDIPLARRLISGGGPRSTSAVDPGAHRCYLLHAPESSLDLLDASARLLLGAAA